MDCDPELADTNIFCKEYGIDLKDSVNAIVVKTKTGELKYAVCALLATTKLDINKKIRKKLGARKVSFADVEETIKLTTMNIGGVTPLTLPSSLSLWVDSKVMQRNCIILGGGNRSSKIKISPKIFHYTPNTEIVDGLAK
jgi:prolyl-tRNA editing enzyme YbaK/EbsC (Cys-tRNA(Pro) deacylase)